MMAVAVCLLSMARIIGQTLGRASHRVTHRPVSGVSVSCRLRAPRTPSHLSSGSSLSQRKGSYSEKYDEPPIVTDTHSIATFNGGNEVAYFRTQTEHPCLAQSGTPKLHTIDNTFTTCAQPVSFPAKAVRSLVGDP